MNLNFANIPNAYASSNEALDYPTAFESPYITGPFTSMSDGSQPGFDGYFDHALYSVEEPQRLAATSPTTPTTGQLKTPYNSQFGPPMGQPEQFSPRFSLDANSVPFDLSLSPSTHTSRTSSLYGDGPQEARLITSPSDSPGVLIKRENTDPPSNQDDAPLGRRTRGRAAAAHNASPPSTTATSTSATAAYSTATKSSRTPRLPHNQVERKYREGLNASLERLRSTVPTLTAADSSPLAQQPRASKQTVLTSAIEYIKALEKERDQLREENTRLRSWAAESSSVGMSGSVQFAEYLPLPHS